MQFSEMVDYINQVLGTLEVITLKLVTAIFHNLPQHLQIVGQYRLNLILRVSQSLLHLQETEVESCTFQLNALQNDQLIKA